MALIGNLSTNSYSGRYYKLSWTAKQNIESNKSTISWTLEALGGNSSWYAERTLKVVIAGTTVYSKTERVERAAGVVTSGTIDLTHDNEGKKQFTASVEAAVYVTNINLTGSKTFTLDAIPRKALVTEAQNFNDEANPVIKYSNPFGNNVTALEACISLTGATDDIAYRAISKTGTSYTFYLTDAERNVLRNAAKNSKSITVRFYVRTTIGTTKYLSYVSKTLTIVNAAPTLNPTAIDTGSVSAALTGDGNIIIKGYNVVQVASNAAALKGATIVSQKISCGSKSINSGSGALYYVDSNVFTFTATDSRGNTTTKTLTKQFVNYIKPTCVLTLGTVNATGEVNFTVDGSVFSGNIGKTTNGIIVDYRYKTDSGSYGDWVTATHSASNNKYTAAVKVTGLDYQSIYTFQARIRDSIYSGTGEPATLSNEVRVKIQPVFDWGKDDFKFNVPVSYLDKKLFYTAGDTVTMTDAQICFSGFVSNGQKQLYITIPISKPIFATGVSFSGTVLCRSLNGYINGTTYSADTAIDLSGKAQGYTIRKYLNEVGITLIIDFTSAITNVTVNNAPISATPYGTLTITFS